jgi:hypothetical protein
MICGSLLQKLREQKLHERIADVAAPVILDRFPG